MANTKISALPTYTGDTTGVYLVMDNSGLTQTYKVAKETLIGSSGTSGTSGTSGSSGVSVPSYYLTSTSSVTIDGSNPVFTTNIPGDTNGLQLGQFVRAYDATNPSNYIQGTILVLIGTLLQITNQNQGGSGTHNNWIISSFGVNGTSGLSGTSGSSGISGSSGASGSSGTSGVNAIFTGYTNAGAINVVGWGATTSAPGIGTTTRNTISVSQLGDKQYQIVMSFQTDGTGGSAGNGDYLFTLPNGLYFDMSLPWQTQYQGNVQTSIATLSQYVIPSGTGAIGDFSGSASAELAPIVWDYNRFRLLINLPGVANKCMGSNFYPTNVPFGFQFTFQFTSQY